MKVNYIKDFYLCYDPQAKQQRKRMSKNKN